MYAIPSAPPVGDPAHGKGILPTSSTHDVVELGLLLPSQRVKALIELSRRRNQSVGQLLRALIDEAIREG